MTPDCAYLSRPIHSLQAMLRVIQVNNHQRNHLVPDGIYGQQTLSAVSDFQQTHGLPVTGITDQKTWDSIVEEYDHAVINQEQPCSLNIIMRPGEQYTFGDTCPYILLAQAMLTTLSQKYHCIPLPTQSGILDDATREAIQSFQKMCCLQTHGNLDKETWKHLVLQFPHAACSMAKEIPDYS